MFSNDDLLSMQPSAWVVADKDAYLVRETMEGRERYALVSDIPLPPPTPEPSIFDKNVDEAELFTKFAPINEKGVDIDGYKVISYTNNTVFSESDKDSVGMIHVASESFSQDSFIKIDGVTSQLNGCISGTPYITVCKDGIGAKNDIYLEVKDINGWSNKLTLYEIFCTAGEVKNLYTLVENCSTFHGTVMWGDKSGDIELTLKNCNLSEDTLPFNTSTKNNGGTGNLEVGNVTKRYINCSIDESNPSYAMLTRINDTKFSDNKTVKIGDVNIEVKNSSFKIVEGTGSGMEGYRLPLMYILKNTGKYSIEIGNMDIYWEDSVISGNTHGYNCLLFGPCWMKSGSGHKNCDYTVNSIHFTLKGGSMDCAGFLGTGDFRTGDSLNFTVNENIVLDLISGNTTVSLHPINTSKTTYQDASWTCTVKGDVIFNIGNEFTGEGLNTDILFGGSVQDPFDVSGDIIVNVSGDNDKFFTKYRGSNYGDWGECKAILNLTDYTGSISGEIYGFNEINLIDNSSAKLGNLAKIVDDPQITPSVSNHQNKEVNFFLDHRDSSLMNTPMLSGSNLDQFNIYVDDHQLLGNWTIMSMSGTTFPSGGIALFYDGEYAKTFSAWGEKLSGGNLVDYGFEEISGIVKFSKNPSDSPSGPPSPGPAEPPATINLSYHLSEDTYRDIGWLWQEEGNFTFELDEAEFNNHPQWHWVNPDQGNIFYIVYAENSWFITHNRTTPTPQEASLNEMPIMKIPNSSEMDMPRFNEVTSVDVAHYGEGDGTFEGFYGNPDDVITLSIE